jgi:pimeloyl-ACP methyl ester carboxylesterase
MAEPLARSLLSANAGPAHFERLVDSVAALHKASYIKTIEATMGYDRAVDISTISVPVQLIYGAEDRLPLARKCSGKSRAPAWPSSRGPGIWLISSAGKNSTKCCLNSWGRMP